MTDLDAGCEGVLCASRTLLTADLATVFADRVTPTWVRSLASGDRDVMSATVLHSTTFLGVTLLTSRTAE